MSLTGGHLDALLAAGASAEQIVALVKAELAERDSVTARRRERDRERQRKHRSRDVTVTKRDKCDPPKSNIKPPSSVSDETGVPPADPVKMLFDVGVSVLVGSGCNEKQARSLIGKWRKAKGDGPVLQALIDCRSRAISNPVEWLEKRFAGAKYVSATGYEYRGTPEQVLREAEKRHDMGTYWRVKAELGREKAA